MGSRLAIAELPPLAERTFWFASMLCQVGHPGFPLVLPATVWAALAVYAAQPSCYGYRGCSLSAYPIDLRSETTRHVCGGSPGVPGYFYLFH